MATTSCSVWMTRNPKCKAWGKKLAGLNCIDLDKERGFCLGGAWVGWTDLVEIRQNEFLVVASATSMAGRGYTSLLVEGGDIVREVKHDEIGTVLECAVEANRVTKCQLSRASTANLYRFGLYCYLRFSGFAAAMPEGRTDEAIRGDIAECKKRLFELTNELERLWNRTPEKQGALGDDLRRLGISPTPTDR